MVNPAYRRSIPIYFRNERVSCGGNIHVISPWDIRALESFTFVLYYEDFISHTVRGGTISGKRCKQRKPQDILLEYKLMIVF